MKIYNWNAEKNEQLISETGISFEEVVFYIENGGPLDEVAHPNSRDYSHQRIFIVAIENYVYLVSFVENKDVSADRHVQTDEVTKPRR